MKILAFQAREGRAFPATLPVRSQSPAPVTSFPYQDRSSVPARYEVRPYLK